MEKKGLGSKSASSRETSSRSKHEVVKRPNNTERKSGEKGAYDDPNTGTRGRSGAVKTKLNESVKNRFATNKNQNEISKKKLALQEQLNKIKEEKEKLERARNASLDALKKIAAPENKIVKLEDSNYGDINYSIK